MKYFSLKSTFIGIGIAVTTFILAGFVFFWFWLDEYQKTLPTQFGDEVITAFEKSDGELLREHYPTFPDELSSTKEFEKYLTDNNLQENLSFYQATSKKKDEIIYEFKGGDKKLAQLTLKPTGEKSFFGFTLYIPIWFELIPLEPYKITVPAGVDLFINDELISQEYLIGKAEQAEIFKQVGFEPLYIYEYEIPEFIPVLSVNATAADGSICNLDWDKTNSTIDVKIIPPDNTITLIKNFALDAAKKYIVFATKIDAPRDELMPLLAPQTLFSQSILKYDNSWGVEYVTDSFSDIIVDRYAKYSDSAFSCRVKLKYNVTNDKGVTKSYDFNSKMYFSMKYNRLYWVGMDSLV